MRVFASERRSRVLTPALAVFSLLVLLAAGSVLEASAYSSGSQGRAGEGDDSALRLDPVAPGGIIHENSRGTFAPEPAFGPALLYLGAGYTLDPAAGDPAGMLPASLRGTPPAAGERGYFLVQFRGPVTVEDRALIESAGAEIVSYVPDYAFLVRADSGAHAHLAASPQVSWTGLYHPAYKISTLPQMSEPERHDLVVLLFPTESVTEAQRAIEAAGGSVLETSDNGVNKLLRIRLASADLAAIARIPAVAWIEPHQIPQWHNNQCQWVVQTWRQDDRRLWTLGIKGQGQVISVADTGVRVTHKQFFDANVPLVTFGDYPTHRKVIAYKKTVASQNVGFGDEAQNSYHGTHTSCTAAGNDAPNASDARDGMALEAKLYFLDGGGYPDPGVFIPLDLNDMFIMPYEGNAGGAARIMSNSWGNSTGGAYDIQAMAADQFMWNHPDFLLFFSNGNDTGVNTVGSPATAKNCVSAGGTGNGTGAGAIYGSTSRGPTDDGRFKPTICSPAGLSSALGANDTGYTTLWGTSMSSPSMAGATVLLRQYLTAGWYPTGGPVLTNAMPTPSAALLKAMAINSADPDVGSYTVPDNNIGWGRIDDDKVCFFPGDAIHLALVDNTEGVLTGEYVEYQVYVASNAVPLKASLVWTDYPGNPSVSIQLVNDLNLTASDGVNTYKGNVYSGGQSTSGGSYDDRNVEECVRRNSPALGRWTFRIEGANVPIGPQEFALVVTGGLAGDAAIVTLDKPTYGGSEQIGIRVIDTNAGGSVTLHVSSDTDGAGESVTLSGADGVYAGTVPLTLGYPIGGDGRLSVSDADQITVSYQDADPPATLTATALVNISGPAISDVHASRITEADLTIAWNTTSPADAKVYYGTTPDLGSETVATTTLAIAQAVTLSDLVPSTLYYYDVESADHQGNSVRDDNGGLHYTVSTDLNRDVLLVIGDGSFDKEQYYLNAFARSGWTYTVWEGAQATTPYVGDLQTGMASFKAVLWQVGLEQYPALTDAARDSLSLLNDLGSRLAIYSHDVAWDFSDPTSPDYSAARKAWFEEELKATWQADPLTWTQVRGYAGDPISGAYTSGIPYTPHREGAAGDEVNGIAADGTFANVWKDNEATPDDIAIRWTGSNPVGDPGLAVWGGTPRKVSSNFFEWAHLNVTSGDDPTRSDVLDKTLIWLVGHDHPTVNVTGPNGGETYTGNTVAISWTEVLDLGYGVGARKIYYSDNGGDRWSLITSAAGPSPYTWDVSSIPNGAQYRVRIVLEDNAAPALSTADNSNANFAINRPGGDSRGPVVLAGSISVAPNPIVVPNPAVLSATVSDVYTGNSNVAAAEWSAGAAPAPAGSGSAMSGSFTAPLVPVTATLDSGALTPGTVTLWVRGRDAAGMWGNATALTVQVNTFDPSAIDDMQPTRFALYRNAPNPFQGMSTIRFDLPRSTDVRLEVFDLAGRRVRTLANGTLGPGALAVTWDGCDAGGRTAGSGVYFYRLRAGSFEAVRKMTLLR